MRRWIFWGVGLAAGAVLLSACDKEPYANFWVNTAADLVDIDPGNGICEATEGARDCSLRAAVMEANAHPGAQHINLVADTTYLLTIDGADEDAAASGDLDIVEAVDIHGEGATIDASALASGDRVFDIDIAEGTVTVDEVTVTGGSATDGAGFRVRNGSLVVDKTTVSGNTGGAAIAVETAAALTVSTSTVSGNTAGVTTAGTTTLAWSAVTDSAAVGVDVTSGLINLTGTIVAANSTDCVLASPVASGGYNIDSDTTCGLDAGTDQAGTDPQLGPLQDNGGPTATRLPAAAGPAVDVGGACSPADQRGTPRDTNGPCDTGPVEWDRGALLALGSPRNFLGTNDMMPESIREDVWLSVYGSCQRREFGDRIMPIADANGVGWAGCGVGNPSNPSGTIVANPEYDPDGYFYVIELDDGDTTPNEPWPYPVQIDLYHAAPCGNGHGSQTGHQTGHIEYLTGESTANGVEYTVTVRNNDSLDPALASVLYTEVFDEIDCAAEQGWNTLYTLSGATEGRYYFQIASSAPADATTVQGGNTFSLRALDSTWLPGGWTCTGDPVVANTDAPYRSDCPAVFGYEYLGIYARIASGGATEAEFFLAGIGAEHAGRTLEVELFDAGEGALTVEVLDPNDNPVAITWEIACQDATLVSETGPCTTGETEPFGGRGPATDTFIDVSGNYGVGGSTYPAECTFKPWGCRNTQTGRYSDRLINIRVDLPTAAAEPTWFAGNTWYKIRYNVGASTSDRTTWTARIIGDPNT